MNFTIYSEPIKPLLLEEIKEIIPGSEITVSDTIIKISGISGNTFFELNQCFPFEAAKSHNYSPKEDYAFSDDEKAILTAFFAESDFIITRDDSTNCIHLYSGEDEMLFEESNFLFWDDNTNITKENIETLFKAANVDFETLLKIF